MYSGTFIISFVAATSPPHPATDRIKLWVKQRCAKIHFTSNKKPSASVSGDLNGWRSPLPKKLIQHEVIKSDRGCAKVKGDTREKLVFQKPPLQIGGIIICQCSHRSEGEKLGQQVQLWKVYRQVKASESSVSRVKGSYLVGWGIFGEELGRLDVSSDLLDIPDWADEPPINTATVGDREAEREDAQSNSEKVRGSILNRRTQNTVSHSNTSANPMFLFYLISNKWVNSDVLLE